MTSQLLIRNVTKTRIPQQLDYQFANSCSCSLYVHAGSNSGALGGSCDVDEIPNSCPQRTGGAITLAVTGTPFAEGSALQVMVFFVPAGEESWQSVPLSEISTYGTSARSQFRQCADQQRTRFQPWNLSTLASCVFSGLSGGTRAVLVVSERAYGARGLAGGRILAPDILVPLREAATDRDTTGPGILLFVLPPPPS